MRENFHHVWTSPATSSSHRKLLKQLVCRKTEHTKNPPRASTMSVKRPLIYLQQLEWLRLRQIPWCCGVHMRAQVSGMVSFGLRAPSTRLSQFRFHLERRCVKIVGFQNILIFIAALLRFEDHLCADFLWQLKAVAIKGIYFEKVIVGFPLPPPSFSEKEIFSQSSSWSNYHSGLGPRVCVNQRTVMADRRG